MTQKINFESGTTNKAKILFPLPKRKSYNRLFVPKKPISGKFLQLRFYQMKRAKTVW